MIAAGALHHGLGLVTGNAAHYRRKQEVGYPSRWSTGGFDRTSPNATCLMWISRHDFSDFHGKVSRTGTRHRRMGSGVSRKGIGYWK